jgi:SAM-dependent methyltransferase
MIDALIRETGVRHEDAVLEIGIGTGRIAISVAEHVRRLLGIDLSQEMMGVLKRKLAQANVRIELAQANAVRLPFPDDAFPLTYAVHVFHLVENWRAGIAEAMRVTKTGGHFVVSFHFRPQDSPNAQLRKQMHQFAQEYGVNTRRPGAQSDREIFEEISKWDQAPRVVVCSAWREAEVPEKILEELDRQIFSETWLIPRDVMDRVVPRLRQWAEETYGDLKAPIENDYETRWLIAHKRKGTFQAASN